MQYDDKKVSAVRGWLARLVRLASKWAWRDQLKLQANVNEDAQSLVDALLRGERADAYCGYGRDGQASNYRDELKWSLRDLKSNVEDSHVEERSDSELTTPTGSQPENTKR